MKIYICGLESHNCKANIVGDDIHNNTHSSIQKATRIKTISVWGCGCFLMSYNHDEHHGMLGLKKRLFVSGNMVFCKVL